MKKFFTLALAVAAASQFTVFGEAKYRLASVTDDFYATTISYDWNDDNQLIKQTYEGDDERYYLYFYDEAGDMVREEMYVDPTGEGKWRLQVSYVWGYNADHEIVTCNGFSHVSWSETPIPSPKLEWVYDTQGHIVQRLTYNMEETEVRQEVNYVYNEAGQLTQQSDLTWDPEAATMQPSYVYKYSYDDQGRLVDIACGSYSKNTLVVNRHECFVYDEAGDLIEYFVSNSNVASKQQQLKYYYDTDVPVDEVIYPYLPQEELLLNTSRINRIKHQLIGIDEFSRADNGDMVLMFEWKYNYTDLENKDGIENIASVADGEIAVTLNGDMLTFGTDVKDAAIYTIDGRLAMRASRVVNGSIPVSGLVSGAYVVKTSAGSAKFVK